MISKPINIPDWIDRRTAEWCAAICDHVSAEGINRGARVAFARGADACAAQIRGAVSVGKPALSAVKDQR